MYLGVGHMKPKRMKNPSLLKCSFYGASCVTNILEVLNHFREDIQVIEPIISFFLMFIWDEYLYTNKEEERGESVCDMWVSNNFSLGMIAGYSLNVEPFRY